MTECIEWPGARLPSGYGRWRGTTAHRATWEQRFGTIGDPDLVVDHICFNRACVNIEHLQLIPRSENAQRQRSALSDACHKGHPFNDANTYWVTGRRSGGRRRCRACDAERHRIAYAKRKAVAA